MAEKKLRTNELIEQTKEYTPVEIIDIVYNFITVLKDDIDFVDDNAYLNNLHKLDVLRYYITHL